ncbi:MAG: DUF255 domain-containing protein [Gemmatimonadota bacterium]|nr:MAG: DUF255 domain-containing protein [Gemmatimonadota bacterium]
MGCSQESASADDRSRAGDEGAHGSGNRLVSETSPYLLQHAHNPVNWYPWGQEAFAEAKRSGRPILLSIGYSACHWCHVMERESFEDETIAALMNSDFVNIKVDREERPDLDEIYMTATVTMNQGHGGWPMSVFLTPELEPVFAGTYFPPSDMPGRPGFPTVLREVARAWREDRAAIRARASEFAKTLRQRMSLGPPLAVGEAELRLALKAYKQDFDEIYGGFGPAPKFPPAVGIGLLLRLNRRLGDPQALAMARKTLEAMARGGMYDHVGGGFARYSTDRRWLVPHFEKMLYDNALLAKAYIEGYQATGEESFKRIARETLDYIVREMIGSEGGIYSSTDADSEGVEGKFFVWTPEEVGAVLEKEEARRFNAYYDITLNGNWEGKSIPNTPHPLSAVAKQMGIMHEELRQTLEVARQKIYAARLKRVKPGLDDKIITSWNGLMIGALAEGYRAFRDRRYLDAAERAAQFVRDTLSRPDGRLLRTYRDGRAHLDAYLEDYAYLSEGLIDLFEAGGSVRWLRAAERLLERALADFIDETTGAFYNTARDHEPLIMRFQDGTDGATPSGNAVIALSLARISYHLDRPDLRHAAVRAIMAYGPMITRFPRGFAKSLCTVDFLLEGPTELAFVGTAGSEDLETLRREVAKHHLPNRIEAALDPQSEDGTAQLPLLRDKTTVNGKAALYICRDFACRTPITDPADVATQLSTQQLTAAGQTTIAIHIPGRATNEGTKRYAARFAAAGYATLGSTGLTTSRLGFGGYRTHDRLHEHGAALELALRSGINIVDTSTNYMDGASERLVGGTLRQLIDSGALARDEVIVVSKIGYVQSSNLERAREREGQGRPFPDMVKHEEGLWHCIHPEFLEDQLRRSLDRLELETLDCCLLHNPEYFLSDAHRRGQPLGQAREEFYGRLTEAFRFLEQRVSAGDIGGYGISSNTAIESPNAPDAVSLTRALAAAREAGGAGHHFHVLQLPLNLYESDAVFELNNGPDDSATVLDTARQAGIAVLANRPLNAFIAGTLVRLADVEVEDLEIEWEEQLGRVADLEMMFRAEIAPKLQTAPEALDPSEYFRMAERLRQVRQSVTNLAHWSQIEAQISYTVSTIVVALNRRLDGEFAERWIEWRDAYLGDLEDLMRALRRLAAERSRDHNTELREALDPLLPRAQGAESLSRIALWVVASTPGVTCVLNGMRSEAYVKDSIGVLGWPKLEGVQPIYRAAKRSFQS